VAHRSDVVLRDCGGNASSIIGGATDGEKTTRRHGADRDYACNVADGRRRGRVRRNCHVSDADSASVSLPILKCLRSPVEVRV
jgi:hypothetical protein